jgi:hypothetical protein
MIHITGNNSTYTVEPSFQKEINARVAGIWLGNPTKHSWVILRKAKGDHLDRVHSDQNVLKMIKWGRLVLIIGGQESQTQGTSGSSPFRSDGSRDGQAGGWSA